MQWPPTPMLGINGISPKGLVEAAFNVSDAVNPKWNKIFENSFTSAMLTCLNVFSKIFAASAASGLVAINISPQNFEYRILVLSVASLFNPAIILGVFDKFHLGLPGSILSGADA